MYYVYILQSINFDKSYVGLTNRSVKERLAEHNNGESKYTKRYVPWKIVYYEILHCRICAESRERFYKSGIGVRIKHILINNFEGL